MKRGFAVFGLIVLLFLIQVTVLPILLSPMVRPDLLLIFTVSCGLLFGRVQAVGVGFCAGLLQDLMAGSPFGIYTLSKMISGYVAGLVEQKVFKQHVFLPVVAMAVASILNSVVIVGLLSVLGQPVGWEAAIAGECIPAVLYNLLFAIPVHQLSLWLLRVLN